jgi:hypothetical protein
MYYIEATGTTTRLRPEQISPHYPVTTSSERGALTNEGTHRSRRSRPFFTLSKRKRRSGATLSIPHSPLVRRQSARIRPALAFPAPLPLAPTSQPEFGPRARAPLARPRPRATHCQMASYRMAASNFRSHTSTNLRRLSSCHPSRASLPPTHQTFAFPLSQNRPRTEMLAVQGDTDGSLTKPVARTQTLNHKPDTGRHT